MLRAVVSGVFRQALVAHAAICGILAAVSCTSTSCVGAPVTPVDSEVRLTSVSYSPDTPVHRGEQVTFEAGLNIPTGTGHVVIVIGDPPLEQLALNDSGTLPDKTAYDGIWSGAWHVSETIQTGMLPVKAQFIFDGTVSPLEQAGQPLVVTESED